MKRSSATSNRSVRNKRSQSCTAFERTYLVNLIASVIAIAAAVLVYFFVLIRIGGLTREDVLQAPKGTKLLRILEKIRWM